MVFDTARRADNQARSGPQVAELAAHAGAANKQSAAKVAALADTAAFLLNLLGQFAGRRDYQGFGLLAGKQSLQNRYGEGRRFAGAGVGQADDVTALKRQRDSLVLDGRWHFKAFAGQVAVDDGVDREVLEAVLGRVILGLGRLGDRHETGRVDIFTTAFAAAGALAAALIIMPGGIVN